jgi:glyoxylase-like metal-dependent hydrolase (beta-lactamase superfamily II)
MRTTTTLTLGFLIVSLGAPSTPKPPSVQRVADGVFAVLSLYHPSSRGRGVNAAFIGTSRTIVFIDSGMTVDSAEFIWNEAVKRFPGRSRSVLVLTHFHCDHTFGMGYFKARGATAIGHRLIVPWLDPTQFAERLKRQTGKPMTFPEVMALESFENPDAGRRILGNVVLSSPDRVIEGDDVLEVDDLRLDLLHVPGHSPDSVCVFERRTGTLIAGDLVYNGGPPFLHDESKEAREQWIRSLLRVERLAILRIVPGHGPVCGESAIADNIRSLRGSDDGAREAHRTPEP